MKLKLSFPYIITFLLLVIIMLELHEITHITVGRIICGCWGTRDFNVWRLCDSCDTNKLAWLATIAGPLFSFALMWAGWCLLKSSKTEKKAVGFALVFANIPFGRITTVMMGGGDEMVVTRHFLQPLLGRTAMILICTTILLLAGVPPVVRAYKTIDNKFRWLYIVAFLTLPLVLILLYVLTFLNRLLLMGVLSTPFIMGTPLLITLHTAVAVILLLTLRKNLSRVSVAG